MYRIKWLTFGRFQFQKAEKIQENTIENSFIKENNEPYRLLAGIILFSFVVHRRNLTLISTQCS